MDEIVTEEQKPFDEVVKEEEDAQPEPEEVLTMDSACGRVWSVKIPKHLMEKWSAVDEENKHLATIRVYDNDPRTGRQRIMLLIPPSDAADGDAHPDEYELDFVNEAVENQIVVAEREKTPNSRARMTTMTGTVKHECNLRPLFTDRYRKRMKQRHLLANTPTRQIKMLDDQEGRGKIRMLTSGVANTSAFSSLVKTKPKPQKGEFERFARLPRNQLLDALFTLYRERARWSAKDLRSRTEQPEGYLKEVLQEIADLHRSGEFNGLYELKPVYRDSVKSEAGANAAAASLKSPGGDVVADVEMDEDYDEEEDDDDDMEEIS